MSEVGEELNRIANSLEKIASKKENDVNEATIVASVYNAVAIELEKILDTLVTDFELRRALRKFLQRIKESALQ